MTTNQYEVRCVAMGYCGACKRLIPCFDGGGPYDCTACNGHDTAWQIHGGDDKWFWFAWAGQAAMAEDGPHGPFDTHEEAAADLRDEHPLVRHAVSSRWLGDETLRFMQLPDSVLDCPLDSLCGRRVQAICAAADALIAVACEGDTRRAVMAAVIEDCSVIVNG